MQHDVTAQHVVQAQGLHIEPLTVDQAIILMGATNLKMVPEQVFQDDLKRRGGEYTTDLYREEFLRLIPDTAEDDNLPMPQLTKRVMNILQDKMEKDPFARWDTRVDVLIATHLNHHVKTSVTRFMKLYFEADVTFTERPGDKPQTWIVINRPDPSKKALDLCIEEIQDRLTQLSLATPLPGSGTDNIELTMPWYLPDDQWLEFALRLGSDLQVNTFNSTVDPKARHETKLILFKDPSGLGPRGGKATFKGRPWGIIKNTDGQDPDPDDNGLNHYHTGGRGTLSKP